MRTSASLLNTLVVLPMKGLSARVRAQRGCCSAILALSVAGLTTDTLARTFHVASSGDDANPGTSELPLRTMQKAAEIARAGDTVLVRGGVCRGYVYLRYSGEPDKRIMDRNEVPSVGSLVAARCQRTRKVRIHSLWTPTGSISVCAKVLRRSKRTAYREWEWRL